MLKDEKSLASGLIFIALGGGLIVYALFTLQTGTSLRMGPGYFPIMIGACLVVIGGAIIATMKGESRILFRNWPWRAIALILASVLIFAVGLDRMGFLPSCFLMVLVAAMARWETTLPTAIAVAVAITAFATAVFIWGLGLPMQLI